MSILIDMNIEKWLIIDHENQRYRLVKEGDLLLLQSQLNRYPNPSNIWDQLLTCDPVSFGKMYRQHRESAGVMVSQLESISGIKEPNIRNIELGHRNPRPSTRKKLIEALKTAIKD